MKKLMFLCGMLGVLCVDSTVCMKGRGRIDHSLCRTAETSIVNEEKVRLRRLTADLGDRYTEMQEKTAFLRVEYLKEKYVHGLVNKEFLTCRMIKRCRTGMICWLAMCWPDFPEGEPKAPSDFALRFAALGQPPLPVSRIAPLQRPLPVPEPLEPAAALDDAEGFAPFFSDSDDNPEDQVFWEDSAFGSDLEGWDCGGVSSHSTFVSVGRKYVVRDAM
ncbi:MAG: hypothetical protein LBJ96_01295 [Holosporaceae bacterium]|nr:hypothetical protein [Holosporaceae bacterium]